MISAMYKHKFAVETKNNAVTKPPTQHPPTPPQVFEEHFLNVKQKTLFDILYLPIYNISVPYTSIPLYLTMSRI